jgi:hypothetical protein
MAGRNANIRTAKKGDGGAGCWNVISSPNSGLSSRLNAVTGSGNDVWAVGYSGDGNRSVTLTLHWDGNAWSVVPSPNVGGDSNFLYGVSGSGNDVWAVGSYFTFDQGFHVTRSLTLHWNGSAWSVAPSPNPGFWGNDLYAVTGSGNDLWAVGDYSDQIGRTLTLHWDGSTWSYVPSPTVGQNNNELTAVAGNGNDVWAVGYYNSVGTVTLHWNGSTWSLVPSPNPGISVNALYGVSGSGNDVWAVGQNDITGDIYRTLTLHWNGSAWSHVPSPNLPPSNNSPLTAVSGSGTDVWAVGYSGEPSLGQALTMHWDGSVWSLVPSANPGMQANEPYGVTGHGNDVWAVGDYINACCNAKTLTLRWTSPCTPIPESTVSRKTHGAAGNFDVDLPLTGTPGIECRRGGSTNDYTIVVTFGSAVTVNGTPQAQVTSGIGEVGSGGVGNGGMVTVSGNAVTIPLTNIANAQTINVTLFGVDNGSGSGNVVLPMSVLVGDSSGDGRVNATDVVQTKSRVGQPVLGTSFRSDVDANGVINATDTSIIKAHVGTSLRNDY